MPPEDTLFEQSEQYVGEGGRVDAGALVTRLGTAAVYTVSSGLLAIGAAAIAVPRRLVEAYGSFYGDYVGIALGGIADASDTAWQVAAQEASELGVFAPVLLVVVMLASITIATAIAEGGDE
ncbi:hypothetical protein [Halobaculum marinum]|uniref:Uncharacterized protein n=1 Tax=Halobaculum marinum TaxID=3031996 RepID=A0ABD5WR76_9EURY|nr:hypothetical protein [Halobaculum sp. DT55]